MLVAIAEEALMGMPEDEEIAYALTMMRLGPMTMARIALGTLSMAIVTSMEISGTLT